MFLNIQVDLIILKTYDQQFTLTTKKSLPITFKGSNIPSIRSPAVAQERMRLVSE